MDDDDDGAAPAARRRAVAVRAHDEYIATMTTEDSFQNLARHYCKHNGLAQGSVDLFLSADEGGTGREPLDPEVRAASARARGGFGLGGPASSGGRSPTTDGGRLGIVRSRSTKPLLVVPDARARALSNLRRQDRPLDIGLGLNHAARIDVRNKRRASP
jgi:hypothetical protein